MAFHTPLKFEIYARKLSLFLINYRVLERWDDINDKIVINSCSLVV